MLSEHNPIAELITQIQKKWIEEASPFPELKFLRWLIKPEEARLYEGFLKLESTEHGAIPEVLVAMLSPFKNEETYSLSLVNDWCKAYKEDKKTQEKLDAKGMTNTWNPETFLAGSAAENVNHDDLFLKMISSFHKEMVDKSLRLVVALLPYSVYDMDGFKRWVVTMLKKEIPGEISFMIFDHIGEYYFDRLFDKYPDITKSLHVDLDLDGAVSKIAKMGNSNSPEVKFRECILEMGKSLQKNNLERLQEWGEKGLLVTQVSGLKSLYASAHIVYAGMLFNFKQFDKIDLLLTKGLVIAKQGLKLNDMSCKPLLIQFYGFIAASKQLQKQMTEAINMYEKQGDLATEYQLPAMALSPYQQAYTLSKKNMPDRYGELLQKAFSAGKSLEKEEQQYSNFAGIAHDLWEWLEGRQRWEEAQQVDDKLREIFGADWKTKAENPGAPYTIDTQEQVSEPA